MLSQEKKEELVRAAIAEAVKGAESGNSPFGAILCDKEGNIIARAHNTTRMEFDPIAHAEINLIRKVVKKLGTKDLSDYYLVSNAQSCAMCFTAAIKCKITNFIYGYAEDETLTPPMTVHDVASYCKHSINITTDILPDECKKQVDDARVISRARKAKLGR